MELHALKPQLTSGLQAMRSWFHSMVDPSSGRLYYKLNPKEQRFVVEPSPVRDLGTVADLGMLQSCLGGGNEFGQVMDKTLAHYKHALVRETEPEHPTPLMPWSFMDPARLGEPSSIAHNSMFVLALAAHEHYPHEEEKERLMAELADGILQQQRADGTYKVYFAPPHLGDFGFELYAGEAMLALMTAYGRLGDERYLASVERALPQYERIYRSGGVGHDELVFFANWQSQAGRLLAQQTSDAEAAAKVADYLYHLHDTIINKLKLYDAVQKHPERMATVEVACGMEGLVDAYTLALQGDDAQRERQRHYAAAIQVAMNFLQEVQEKSGAGAGGFGHGLHHPQQRIDVTGHVSSAYIKLLGVLEEREP